MGNDIASVKARRIWDSRGRPTIEVEIALSSGVVGRGIAPAGASRGIHEAVDLRDGGAAFKGLGVARAIENVEGPIARALIGRESADQAGADAALIALDPSATRSVIGGNASIAASMAVLNAAAAAAGEPLWRYLAQSQPGSRPVRLPLPEIQIFGGGAHAGRRIDIQDLLIMPLGATSFSRAMEMTADVYAAAGDIMDERGRRSGVADEGGWWPDFDSNEQAIETLLQSIERAGYRPVEDVAISLDLAASEFYHDGLYHLGLDRRALSRDEWIDVVVGWQKSYQIVSIEDPVSQEDADGMALVTARLGKHAQVIGDDFLVTNTERIIAAIAAGCCNAVLLKPNQVGTITETYAALQAAKAAGWGCVVSARSGETEDTIITHLATGWDAGQLKVGSFARSERMAKWNEALRIEDTYGLGFAGARALPLG